MNSGIPTQSASVLRNIGHSAALAFARFRDIVAPTRRPGPAEPIALAWKALGVATLCAVSAFAYFWFEGSPAYRSSVTEIAPAADTKEVPANVPTESDAANPGSINPVSAPVPVPVKQAPATSATEVPIPLPARRTPNETEFVLSPSPEFQRLGPVYIKLRAVHPERHTCDVTLKISNGHEWTQREVRINQPIPLVRGTRSTQLVVKQIFEDRVSASISAVGSAVR